MERAYVVEQTFEKVNFITGKLPMGDYEACTFIDCIFASTDLSGNNFTECVFKGCDLSSARLMKTALKDVSFNNCKLLGLHFFNCNDFLFSVSFDSCMLNLSSFYRMKLAKTVFSNCEIAEADFTEADLTAAMFDNCNLLGTTFDQTIIEKADLRTAYNYSIDPVTNRIRKAKFSLHGVAGLLDRYDIVIE